MDQSRVPSLPAEAVLHCPYRLLSQFVVVPSSLTCLTATSRRQCPTHPATDRESGDSIVTHSSGSACVCQTKGNFPSPYTLLSVPALSGIWAKVIVTFVLSRRLQGGKGIKALRLNGAKTARWQRPFLICFVYRYEQENSDAFLYSHFLTPAGVDCCPGFDSNRGIVSRRQCIRSNDTLSSC